MLVQQVQPDVEIQLAIETATTGEAAIAPFLERWARQPFDLTRAPLLRAALLKLDDNDAVFAIAAHHIAFDKWSEGILCRELSTLYDAFVRHRFSPLPAPPIQYADFACWQRQQVRRADLEPQLAYWQQHLSGRLPVLRLPADRPAPKVKDQHGAKITQMLSPEVKTALEEFNSSQGTTLFMTLLAVFNVLLYRYSNQEDIIVGSPVAGRNQGETQDLIGCFLNSLALRSNLSGNPSFLDLLDRVRHAALDAFANQDIAFETLIERLQPERDLGRHPIFDVMLNVLNTPAPPLELTETTVEAIDTGQTLSQFALTLYVREVEAGLKLELVYQTACFSHDRATMLLDRFAFLLEGILADPHRPIRDYSLVSPQARSRLPDPSIPLAAPYYDPAPDLIAARSQADPEAIALTWRDTLWTYRKLSDRATALAKLLCGSGVCKGDIVAISGPRSLGLIASALGVLKSGGVLLTLDPQLPPERRQFMLDRAGVRWALWVDDSSIPDWKTVEVWRVRPETGESEFKIGDTELPAISPEDPAYLFFTSGTTGTPKGILGCHKGLSHFLHWQRHTFNVGPGDRVAQLTGLSFDVVLRDIFLPLTSGATLCLPDFGQDLRASRVLPWLELSGITLMHAVPTLAQTWLADAPEGISLRQLRQIFFAGEPLRDRLVTQWRDRFPEAGEIVNLYGPTETTLAKCFYRVPSPPDPGVQPVGQPLPHAQVLVMDDNQRLCDIGEPGEIVIRTPFRSLGYVGAPESDRQRFLPNPYRDDGDDVLYRTGDGGRYRPDGRLEILGRRDRQVKIRGVRLELGEIETVLNQHPQIRQAVVLVREDKPGDKRLVAYAVPRDRPPTTGELRRFLRPKLAPQGIPSAFVILQKLPVTPNGKVDRRALPAPEVAVGSPQEIEDKLLAIWIDLLAIDAVEVEDDFFTCGGDSLLALNLLSHLEREFGKSLTLGAFLERPTIAHLAIILQQEETACNWHSLVPIHPQGSQPPLFAIHVLGEGFEFYRDIARHLGDDRSIYGLRYGLAAAQGGDRLDRDIPAGLTWNDIIENYVQEICTFQPEGPYFLMGMYRGGIVAVCIAQRLRDRGRDVALVALLDSQSPEENDDNYPDLPTADLEELATAIALYPSMKDRQAIADELQSRIDRVLESLGDRRPQTLANTTTQSQIVPPRNQLERQLVALWEDILQVRPIGIRDDFFELGGHSLLTVRLVAEIEKTFGQNLPLTDLFAAATVEQLAKLLQISVDGNSATTEDDGVDNCPLSVEERRQLMASIGHRRGDRVGQLSLMVKTQQGTSKTKPPLFFLGWGLDRPIDPERTVYCLPYGIEMRDPANYVQTLASIYIEEICRVQPQDPYVLGGACFGGWIAYEIAQQLQARGKTVSLLALIETPGPDTKYWRYQPLIKRAVFRWRQWKQMSPSERIAEIVRTSAKWGTKLVNQFKKNKIDNGNKMGENLAVEQPIAAEGNTNEAYLARVKKATRLAMQHYQFQPYRGDVVLFFARDPVHVSPLFPAGGWDGWVSGSLSVRILPGDHLSLLQQPYLNRLTAELKDCLDAVASLTDR